MGTLDALPAIFVTGEFPAQRQRPVTRSFDVFLINGWGNNRQAGDFRRHRAHYDVTVMIFNIRVHDVFYKDYLMQ